VAAPRSRHASVHAEHVGSLLRPAYLLEARARHRAGELTDDELRDAEDRAALDAIAVQRSAGIGVFTDGEVRRETWMAGMMESVGGTVVAPSEFPPAWHRVGGPPDPEETSFNRAVVTGKVYRKNARTSVEASFMAGHSPGPYKVTMISSSMGAQLWQPGLSAAVYPTPADLVADLMRLQIEEITDLLDQGVNWLQLDSLGYLMVVDDEYRASRGMGDVPASAILESTVAADQTMIAAARAKDPDVTIGMHICRGNNRSAWLSTGGYEPLAERLFGTVDVDRFLLEYDTERAGGFEPLRFVRPDVTVVLGLVSSKTPVLESQDALRRRIDEASRYVPLENLALSPQCGFASTEQGNLLTIDEEKRKLELVAGTAQKVWG
jgi:5-methyltetrahydropteroyltriglutamate--homocysteine methyltransferase